jgi:hypothetical protein
VQTTAWQHINAVTNFGWLKRPVCGTQPISASLLFFLTSTLQDATGWRKITNLSLTFNATSRVCIYRQTSPLRQLPSLLPTFAASLYLPRQLHLKKFIFGTITISRIAEFPHARRAENRHRLMHLKYANDMKQSTTKSQTG